MDVTSSRRPPAVLYPLRRSRALGCVLAGALLAGAGGLGAWFFRGSGAGSLWPVLAGGGLWLVAAASALHFWVHQLSGAIRWDGQSWALESGQPGDTLAALSASPEVLLDVQSHLWLHARPAGRGRIWLWLERSTQPERWMDLRRAVYSRPRPGAGNADETAPAAAVGRES
ncbi:hypothetical protein GmRootA79_12080 [Acidovorax sp. A79]|uniref:hypothetical protein n=1 Tax=Acidovorax sp. A79 TaxID=3056107 RepID=UPI0034E8F15F